MDFLSLLSGPAVEHILDKVSGLIEKGKIVTMCNNLHRKLSETFLQTFENEIYFNDLDKFLSTGKTFYKIIDNCYDAGINTKSKKQLIDEETEHFLKDFPSYSIYKSSILDVLDRLYTISFAEFNSVAKDIRSSTKIITETIKNENEKFRDDMQNFFKNTLQRPSQYHTVINAETDCINSSVELSKSEYYSKVKNIEEDFQKKYKFEEAISKYTFVISEMASTSEHIDTKLKQQIYINVALCNINLAKLDVAKKYLELAENLGNNNEKFYYISALLYCQNGKYYNPTEALACLNKAIEIKEDYNKAVFLRYYIFALTEDKSFDEILAYAQDYKNKQLTSNATTNSELSDYYASLGLAAKVLGHFELAIEYFKKADDLDKNVANEINIAFTYYSWAVEKVRPNKFAMSANVDFEKLNNSYVLLEKLIKSEDPIAKANRQEIVQTYASILTFGDIQKGKASMLDNILEEIEDYDIRRCFILSKLENNCLTDTMVESLSPEDRAIFQAFNFAEQNNFEDAILVLEKQLSNKDNKHLPIIFHNLLVLTISNKNTEKYKNTRKLIEKQEVFIEDLELLDCLYYEIAGKDICEIKKHIDDFLLKTTSIKQRYQALLFYIRNSFHKEAINLIEDIHNTINSSNIILINNDMFYKSIISYLVETDVAVSEKIVNTLSNEKLTEEIFWQVKTIYAEKVKDNEILKVSLYKLYLLTKDTKYLYHAAIACLLCFDNSKCQEYCDLILNNKSADNQNKKAAYILLSQCGFLNNNTNDAIENARKAHEIVADIPNDDAHRFYMQMATLTNNLEDDFKTILDYKHFHPNAVDWIEEKQILEENENGENVFTEEFSKLLNSDLHAKFNSAFNKTFMNSSISIYQLSTLIDFDYIKTFEKVIINGLKFQIASGNIEHLKNERKNIDNSVIVDSCTLLVLGYLDALDILSKFSVVYTTSETILNIINWAMNSHLSIPLKVYKYLKNMLNFTVCSTSNCNWDDQNFSQEIIETALLSKKRNIPYLYADYRIMNDFPINDIPFISIPSVLEYLETSDEKFARTTRYKLLSENKCSFVNFNALDIIFSIKSNNSISEELLKPYLCLKSYYDIQSFITVYCVALKLLKDQNLLDYALAYCVLIVKYCDRLYRIKENQKWLYDRFEQDDYLNCSTKLSMFIYTILKLMGKYLTESEIHQILEKVSLENISEEECKQLLLK